MARPIRPTRERLEANRWAIGTCAVRRIVSGEMSEGHKWRTRMRREVAHAADLDILISARFPPPLGGISVHVSRLVPLLKDAGLRVGVLNHFASKEVPYVVGALSGIP